ncbi:WYL domain-containing protein [Shewanella sp. LC6]|uniref:helix-turn-helix transcriptional regulator n=1 Tax=unclassified Shewanella TaxID=196818 RepID=UPI001126B0D3|nr:MULTISPECIES: WYL domain-containing protein [unclassified Shewanella]QQK58806.1 WYL domain-containing protein [Shewanella sp. LC6]TPE50628.1 WYL domain-containing protein [Shewanella sp. LC2]
MDNLSRNEILAQRLAQILLQLFESGKVSRNELANKFNVSERTIYRDLSRIGSVVSCSKDGVYRILTEKPKKDELPDISSLSEKTGLGKLLPVSETSPLPSLLSAIEYKRIKILPLPPEQLTSEHQKKVFSRLDSAIKDCKICSIQYKGKLRTVRPYRLMSLKGVWYLAATDIELNIKAYQVSGIEWLDVKKATFVADTDINGYLDTEDDAWFSLKKKEVTVEIQPAIARYFERRNILPQQKIISKTTEGKLIVTTQIAHRDQLFPTLRFWLPNVRILKPEIEAETFLEQLSLHLQQISQKHSFSFDTI